VLSVGCRVSSIPLVHAPIACSLPATHFPSVMKVLDGLCDFMLRHPRKVLLLWLAASIVAACFAMKLVDSCRFQFDPIPNTPSFTAQERFGQDFPTSVYSDVEIVLIRCQEKCESVADESFAQQAVDALSKQCQAMAARAPDSIVNWTDHLEFSRSAAARMPGAESPFLSPSKQTMLFELTWQVKPGEQTATMAMLEELQKLVNDLNSQGGDSMDVSLTGSLALFTETLSATKNDIEARDGLILPWALLVLLFRIRSWRLLLIPGFCLAITIATSFSLFLPFAYYRVVNISPFCPTAMLFLALALSIDYSLFLLTRFVEEIEAGQTTQKAIRVMLRESGHVVSVSGTVLVICYLGVLFFPSDSIRTVGFGAAISIFMCIATNLTITPCAIAAFPQFFTPKAGASPFACCRGALCCRRRRSNSNSSSSAESPSELASSSRDLHIPMNSLSAGLSDSPGSGCGAGQCREPIPRSRAWICIANLVTKPPCSILVPILVVALLVLPVTQLLKYEESFATSLTFPRQGQASDAYRLLDSEFPAGVMAPMYLLQPVGPSSDVATPVTSPPPNQPGDFLASPLSNFGRTWQALEISSVVPSLFDGSAPHRVLKDRFLQDDPALDARLMGHYNDLCALAQKMLKDLNQPPSSYGVEAKHLTSLATLSLSLMREEENGQAEDEIKAEGLSCLHWNSSAVDALHKYPISAKMLLEMDNDIGENYRALWKRLMSQNRQSSTVILAPPFDPYGEGLRPFIHAVRRASGSEGTAEANPALLLSSGAILVDTVEVAYQRFPYILAGTIGLVFAVVAIAFRAAFAPVKMFLTVVLPLAAVFGVAVWIYQDDGLKFLHTAALSSPQDAGFYWGTPIFTSTIIIGLALDYDVFLFARVVELRRLGFENNAAVRGGLYLTGPIITSAGLIMAIALGGLLLCDVPSNNQVGFVMTFGVLMDTFVIRTCLVPAVLTLGSGLNYWPQKLPAPTKSDSNLHELFWKSSDPSSSETPSTSASGSASAYASSPSAWEDDGLML